VNKSLTEKLLMISNRKILKDRKNKSIKKYFNRLESIIKTDQFIFKIIQNNIIIL
jgi:hypothetical protein